ncbi:MAG: UPF0149 family protein [Xanthomonadales bacterium]|nr:UPF0149 family protein [Xanthomonadales bacterium]
MAIKELPDFEHSLALAHGNLDASGLTECHGMACGLLVRQPEARGDAFLGLLAMLEMFDQASPALRDSLLELLEATRSQLQDEQLQLALWLPDDSETLEDRTECLAQWCNGFLASVGAGDDPRLNTLSEEARESLGDLQEIAMAELGASEGDALEEEEVAFAEIVEYVRVATLLIREDLRGPEPGEPVH